MSNPHAEETTIEPRTKKNGESQNLAKFGEVAKTFSTTNGSHDGLVASQNDGVRVNWGLSEHEGTRHSLGSPGHDGYKLPR